MKAKLRLAKPLPPSPVRHFQQISDNEVTWVEGEWVATLTLVSRGKVRPRKRLKLKIHRNQAVSFLTQLVLGGPRDHIEALFAGVRRGGLGSLGISHSGGMIRSNNLNWQSR